VNDELAGTATKRFKSQGEPGSFKPDRQISPMDLDGEKTIASTRKMLELAQREHVTLVIFGHDGQQWQTLKKCPEYYE
jgi:N-acyl homoserine lactone hydrolase